MEVSSVFVTPKRKYSRNSSCSSTEASPEEKRAKEASSPDVTLSSDAEKTMAAKTPVEGVEGKLDLIIARLDSMDLKMEDISLTVKKLQSKITSVEVDVISVKDKQEKLEGKFTHMETNSQFVDSELDRLQSTLDERKKELGECRKKILYLEAYSRRENLKFEGIPEVSQNAEEGKTANEDTKGVLVNFIKNTLGVENAEHIEFQRVHRLGKPKDDTGNDGRTIIARFLRFSDKERVFKQGRKLKGTNFKMFEDIPKELHQLRKAQMEKLKQARKEGQYVIIKAEFNDKMYVLINIYAPNKDSNIVSFFNNLLLILRNNNFDEEENIIMGGDFNCPLNPLMDKKGGQLSPRKSVVSTISNLLEEFDLVDIWRVKNPQKKEL
ncbi:unnamed protein product, partial [Porites lobata]